MLTCTCRRCSGLGPPEDEMAREDINPTPDCCFHPDSSCTWVGEVRVEHSREVGELLSEVERLRKALAYIHDWAAFGGEHGAQPHARIMVQAQRTLDDHNYDPAEMHEGMSQGVPSAEVSDG